MHGITVRSYVGTPRLRYYIFGVTLPLITLLIKWGVTIVGILVIYK